MVEPQCLLLFQVKYATADDVEQLPPAQLVHLLHVSPFSQHSWILGNEWMLMISAADQCVDSRSVIYLFMYFKKSGFHRWRG